MNKSVNLIITETKEKLILVLNESQLPAVITSMILHELSQVVDGQVTQIIAQEKLQYNEELRKEEKDDN